jgi:hypothetical protein
MQQQPTAGGQITFTHVSQYAAYFEQQNPGCTPQQVLQYLNTIFQAAGFNTGAPNQGTMQTQPPSYTGAQFGGMSQGYIPGAYPY